MRLKYRYVTVMEDDMNKSKKIRNILDKYSIKYEYKEENSVLGFHWTLVFFLYEDMEQYEEIKNKIKPFKINGWIQTEYDLADMEDAQWYIVYPGSYQYPQPDGDDESDLDYRNFTFNLDNYCPLCGIGLTQSNSYRLKQEPKQRNNQFWGIYWRHDAIFIRQEAKNIFEREKVKGIHFSQPVIHKNSKPVNNFYQLHIDTTLNKGFDTNNAQMVTCKINNEEGRKKYNGLIPCGRVKYHTIIKYVFDKNLFTLGKDFYTSYEYFGSGAYAHRCNIISKNVYEIILKNKLKGLIECYPIFYA